MSNELKEMLQSVIHEAIQPLHERFDKLEARFDKLEARFDKFEAFTRSEFAEVVAKLDSISEQVAANTESIAEIKEQLATSEESAVPTKSVIAQVDALTLDVKVLKKAIAN